MKFSPGNFHIIVGIPPKGDQYFYLYFLKKIEVVGLVTVCGVGSHVPIGIFSL